MKKRIGNLVCPADRMLRSATLSLLLLPIALPVSSQNQGSVTAVYSESQHMDATGPADVMIDQAANSSGAEGGGVTSFQSIAELEAYIAEQEAQLQANRQKLVEHRARLARVRAELAEQSRSEQELREELTSLCDELDSLGSSALEDCAGL